MSKQSTELAWDITDWETDADLSEGNIRYNMLRTFADNGLIFPASIVCRDDQEYELVNQFSFKGYYDKSKPDVTGIRTITMNGCVFKLKVLPLARTQVTYTKAVR